MGIDTPAGRKIFHMNIGKITLGRCPGGFKLLNTLRLDEITGNSYERKRAIFTASFVKMRFINYQSSPLN